jgi:hypothetical protein
LIVASVSALVSHHASKYVARECLISGPAQLLVELGDVVEKAPMSVTLAVSQLLMFWLNELAKESMLPMLVTLAVVQLPMFWLNA